MKIWTDEFQDFDISNRKSGTHEPPGRDCFYIGLAWNWPIKEGRPRPPNSHLHPHPSFFLPRHDTRFLHTAPSRSHFIIPSLRRSSALPLVFLLPPSPRDVSLPGDHALLRARAPHGRASIPSPVLRHRGLRYPSILH
jgi:hypothetical protein